VAASGLSSKVNAEVEYVTNFDKQNAKVVASSEHFKSVDQNTYIQSGLKDYFTKEPVSTERLIKEGCVCQKGDDDTEIIVFESDRKINGENIGNISNLLSADVSQQYLSASNEMDKWHSGNYQSQFFTDTGDIFPDGHDYIRFSSNQVDSMKKTMKGLDAPEHVINSISSYVALHEIRHALDRDENELKHSLTSNMTKIQDVYIKHPFQDEELGAHQIKDVADISREIALGAVRPVSENLYVSKWKSEVLASTASSAQMVKYYLEEGKVTEAS
jgi:hypothetical protein